MEFSSYLFLSIVLTIGYYVLKYFLKSDRENLLKQKPGYDEWKKSSEYLKLSNEIRRTTNSLNEASDRVESRLNERGFKF